MTQPCYRMNMAVSFSNNLHIHVFVHIKGFIVHTNTLCHITTHSKACYIHVYKHHILWHYMCVYVSTHYLLYCGHACPSQWTRNIYKFFVLLEESFYSEYKMSKKTKLLIFHSEHIHKKKARLRMKVLCATLIDPYVLVSRTFKASKSTAVRLGRKMHVN